MNQIRIDYKLLQATHVMLILRRGDVGCIANSGTRVAMRIIESRLHMLFQICFYTRSIGPELLLYVALEGTVMSNGT
jgi:hypothetical protein